MPDSPSARMPFAQCTAIYFSPVVKSDRFAIWRRGPLEKGKKRPAWNWTDKALCAQARAGFPIKYHRAVLQCRPFFHDDISDEKVAGLSKPPDENSTQKIQNFLRAPKYFPGSRCLLPVEVLLPKSSGPVSPGTVPQPQDEYPCPGFCVRSTVQPAALCRIRRRDPGPAGTLSLSSGCPKEKKGGIV